MKSNQCGIREKDRQAPHSIPTRGPEANSQCKHLPLWKKREMWEEMVRCTLTESDYSRSKLEKALGKALRASVWLHEWCCVRGEPGRRTITDINTGLPRIYSLRHTPGMESFPPSPWCQQWCCCGRSWLPWEVLWTRLCTWLLQYLRVPVCSEVCFLYWRKTHTQYTSKKSSQSPDFFS